VAGKPWKGRKEPLAGRVTLRVGPEDVALLDELCAESGLTRSEVIRLLVQAAHRRLRRSAAGQGAAESSWPGAATGPDEATRVTEAGPAEEDNSSVVGEGGSSLSAKPGEDGV
jgi:hypothetical protein